MRKRHVTMMRMAQRLGGIVLMFALLMPSAQAQQITYLPNYPNVEQNITFTFIPAVTPTGETVHWDLGNGEWMTSTNLQIIYAYAQAGTYTVRALTEEMGMAETTVTIQERRRIEYSPNNPLTGSAVEFQAVNFLTSSVAWNFGDGTIRQGSSMDAHTYSAPGLYTVRAVDIGGSSIHTIYAQVMVQMSATSITFSPANPRVSETVTFQAVNFLSKMTIRWDFGDGTIQSGPPPTITHIYQNPGSFLVRAYDGDGRTVTASVQVHVSRQASLSYEPENPRTGELVTFRARDFVSPTAIRWDFGDGTIQTGPPPDMTHVYRNPGTYLVRAYDGGGATLTASINIRIHPPASVIFHPADPRPGEPVTFRAVSFFSTSLIRWDFGEGTILNDTSPPEIIHSFRNPGVYLVRAYDGGGTQITASLSVQVLPPRMINITPPNPRVGEPVILRAVNFISPRILWNPGDGTPPFEGGHEISHAFVREGNIQVMAGDYRNGTLVENLLPATVFPREGPRSPFKISFIGLRFADGKAYTVVARDDGGLQAFAEIKYEGSGVLVAQWLINGAPFRMVSRALAFADSVIIDSGPIPGLPTLVPGLHEVTLAILQPDVEFPIPAIRYFVSVDPGFVRPARFDLSLAGAKDLEGEPLLSDAGRVEVPAEGHVLLQGIVKNEEAVDIAFALLRIHLDEELVDQKILRDLKGGEQRHFESSLYNGSETPKSIFLTLYDISSTPARVLSIREIKIVPQNKRP